MQSGSPTRSNADFAVASSFRPPGSPSAAFFISGHGDHRAFLPLEKGGVMPDSPGEAAARHGLKSSVNDNRTEVALASETIDLLRSEIRIAVTAGIRAGLTEAMNEQNAALLFGALVKAFQNQAQAGAGRWMFGRLRWTASNLLWFLLAMAALYNVGGWAFLKAAWVVYQQTKGNPT